MSASTLTPYLAAAVADDRSGATGVVRQVLDGLLALADDQRRLRAAVDLLTARLPWCGPMWQVVGAAHAPDPMCALRSLRERLDLDVERSVATAVRLLTERGCAVRAAPGSGLVDAVLAALPQAAGSAMVGVAGVDAVGPSAVLNVAGTGDLARALPTIIVATSVKLVPQEVFWTLGAPGFERVELGLFEAVVLDGEVLTPAETGRRAVKLRSPDARVDGRAGR
jgi:hypothetical protein